MNKIQVGMWLYERIQSTEAHTPVLLFDQATDQHRARRVPTIQQHTPSSHWHGSTLMTAKSLAHT